MVEIVSKKSPRPSAGQNSSGGSTQHANSRNANENSSATGSCGRRRYSSTAQPISVTQVSNESAKRIASRVSRAIGAEAFTPAA